MSSNRPERRAYFRINDEIGLTFSVIEDEEEQAFDAEGEVELSLASMLSNLDNEFNETINVLWRENSPAAKAIGLLNRKVSLLTAHVLQEEASEGLNYEDVTASISGCGMAFEHAEPVPVESRLRVSAMLKPSNIHIQFTARVVCCERVSEIPSVSYLLRISIDEECSEAREQLVQHVVQRQFTNHEPSDVATTH